MGRETNVRLSAEQRALFTLIEETPHHLFITGKAGTGKSVLLEYVKEHSHKRLVVVAPTGVAAINVGGQTIHSLFRLPPEFIQVERLHPDPRTETVLKHIDMVVIDEISMVRADVMDAIDYRLRQARMNALPFGGVQVVMFGDLYQLPPVVADEELHRYFEVHHGGSFFFHAHVWHRARFEIYELTEIFRQRDEKYKLVLNAIREGMITQEQLTYLNNRLCMSLPHDEVLTLAATNAIVTTINRTRLAQLPGKAYEYSASVEGKLEKTAFPTDEVLHLKKGAQVMLVKNDKEKRWVNGTLGRIHSLTPTEIKVTIEGSTFSIPQETWEKIRYVFNLKTNQVEAEVVASFTQFPVRLAWAVTIHKSQGQTYDAVVLDMTHDTFAPGQLYVALSRCRSIYGLYLKHPIQYKHIIVEPKVIAFMSQRKAAPVATRTTQSGVSRLLQLFRR